MKHKIDERLNCAIPLLTKTALNISEIAYQVGFNDPRYFCKCFKNLHKISPTEYRDKFMTDKLESEIVEEQKSAFMDEAKVKVISNIDDYQFDTLKLADLMNMSKSTLYRRIKESTEKSPGSFVKYIRLTHARELINKGKKDIYNIAMESGFLDVRYFSKCFKSEFGITPSKFILKGA